MKPKIVRMPTGKQMAAACEKRDLMFPNHAAPRSQLKHSSKVIGKKSGGYVSPLKLGLEEWPED